MATGVILISLKNYDLSYTTKKKKGSKANNQMRRQRSPVDIDTS